MSANKEKKDFWKEFTRFCRFTGRGLKEAWQISSRYMTLRCISGIIAFCSPFWGIWFSARLLDELLGNQEPVHLMGYAIALFLGGLLIMLLCNYLEIIIVREEHIFSQKCQMVFSKKLMELDYCDLEDEKTRELYLRVKRETFNDRKNIECIRMRFPIFLGSFCSMITSLLMIWSFLGGLTKVGNGIGLFLFLIITPLSIVIKAKCNGRSAGIYLQCQNKISANCLERDGYQDYMNNYSRGKTFRIFDVGDLLIRRLMGTHYFNDRELHERYQRVLPYDLAGYSFSEMMNLVIRCLAAILALAGKCTLGQMTQYVSSVSQVTKNISGLSYVFTDFWYNTDYLERYFSFMDIPTKMKKGCIPVEKRVDGEYKVVFDHVSFKYPGSDRYALKDICMEFEIGEKLAVVGMNGSGKSTFIKLLCRLYDPTEGTIYMNGIDIQRYDYKEYLELFSVVFQDFKLFSFGLGENIAVSEYFDEKEVRDAMYKAGLEAFLEKQPKDLQTTLYRDFDKEGVEVSGGEAQKIALARAVCKGAPFVILDEPTAALDPMAEYEIYNRFNDLVADRTTVYISHRMSSCRFCGDIAVFHEGGLVQRGSHESLMQQENGKYYELWTAQAQYYQAG